MSFSIRSLFRRVGPAMPTPGGERRLAQTLVDRGIAAETSGSPADALSYYRKAVEADPGFAPAHMNLGIGLQAAGEPAAAISAYRRAIALDPQYAAAHYNLALAHLKLSEYSQAETSFRAALRFRNAFPEAWVGLADALQGLHRDEEALAALESAIAQRGDYAGALFNAGVLLRKMGRVDAAVEYDRRALEVEPEHYLAHFNLGITLHNLRRFSEAEARFRSALALKPDFAAAQINLAAMRHAQGRKPDSLHALFDAVAKQPESEALQVLAKALDGVMFNSVGEKDRNTLLSLCRDDNLCPQQLKWAVFGLLKNGDAFQRLQNSARRGEDPFVPRVSEVDAFLRDPLLPAVLPGTPIPDAAVEVVLTHLRRWILLRFGAMSPPHEVDPAVPAEFACALARQCFFSGYAFFADEDELRQVAIVRETVEAALRKAGPDFRTLESALTITVLYDPLHTLRGNEQLLEQTDWSEPFRPIVQDQLANRRREQEIAGQLSALTSIEDAVSLAVRDQYEENPYPVWANAERRRPETIQGLWRQLRPDQPAYARPRPVPMLIAGCGTGQLPIMMARMYPECAVLAVDLSLASLSYAARMSEHLGVSNITYRQADILKLGDLDLRFAVIDCSGVLHHLNDPMEGWRILVNLMEPDGLMRICLYSAKARSGLRAATEFIRTLNLPLTPDGIRRGRHAIMGLADDHPGRDVLISDDFFTLNGCRDLLMHVQEHQFTLPRIADCLSQLGLRFLGMTCSPETQRAFDEMFADPGAATDLKAWDRFEDAYPRTFAGMYSFWCCRTESPELPAISH